MIPRRIDGANAFPGAPAGWDEARDGPCGALPVRVLQDTASGGVKQCESAWEPTPRELEMLNAGGSVILRVIGWQVPVAIYAVPPIPEDAA